MALTGRGVLRPSQSSNFQPFVILCLFMTLAIVGYNFWNLTKKNSMLLVDLVKVQSILKRLDASKTECNIQLLAADEKRKQYEVVDKEKEHDLEETRRIVEDLKSEINDQEKNISALISKITQHELSVHVKVNQSYTDCQQKLSETKLLLENACAIEKKTLKEENSEQMKLMKQQLNSHRQQYMDNLHRQQQQEMNNVQRQGQQQMDNIQQMVTTIDKLKVNEQQQNEEQRQPETRDNRSQQQLKFINRIKETEQSQQQIQQFNDTAQRRVISNDSQNSVNALNRQQQLKLELTNVLPKIQTMKEETTGEVKKQTPANEWQTLRPAGQGQGQGQGLPVNAQLDHNHRYPMKSENQTGNMFAPQLRNQPVINAREPSEKSAEEFKKDRFGNTSKNVTTIEMKLEKRQQVGLTHSEREKVEAEQNREPEDTAEGEQNGEPKDTAEGNGHPEDTAEEEQDGEPEDTAEGEQDGEPENAAEGNGESRRDDGKPEEENKAEQEDQIEENREEPEQDTRDDMEAEEVAEEEAEGNGAPRRDARREGAEN